jgi:PBP1b-binding outer membrane lipoprotein LpoB
MNIGKSIIVLLAVIALLTGCLSCKEGPLEQAGKKVDKAVEDIRK